MLSLILTRACATPGGTLLQSRIEVQAEAAADRSLSVPVGNNQLVAFTLDVSQAKALHIQSTKDLTLKTNNSGSPVNTIELSANQAFQWVPTDGPLSDTAGTTISTDITALYVTNAGDAAAQLDIRCLFDPTL